MNIDWSKAPEGAMACVDGWGFFKCEHGEWWVSQGAGWQRTPYNSPENFSWFGAAIWRGKEWTGQGLPPVGTVCEYNATARHEQGKELWCGVVVKYRSDWVIVFECVSAPAGHEGSVGVELFGDVSHGLEKRFRPIRTPEQIAAEERAKLVKEIQLDLDVPLPVATRAYEKGYRKQEQPK